MGVITSIGKNISEFKESLENGRLGISEIEGLDKFGELTVHVAGQVKNFKPTEHGMDAGSARRSDRFSQFGICAAIQAMEQSGLKAGENIEPGRLGCYVGSGIGGMQTFIDQTLVMANEGAKRVSPLFIPMMIGNLGAGNIAIKFNAQGPCLPVVSACATSTHAVGEAFRAIKYGMADAIITGGTEAAVNELAIGGFANMKALTTAENPEEA